MGTAQYGFQKLGLRRIYAQVYRHNKPSVRVLEKNGYEREGTLHKEVKKDGKLMDVYLYAKVR